MCGNSHTPIDQADDTQLSRSAGQRICNATALLFSAPGTDFRNARHVQPTDLSKPKKTSHPAITAGLTVSLAISTTMHPDRKIGIAMGILLIGVVAALFFRNEPLSDDQALSGRRELELNQRLKNRDVAVYLETESDLQTEDNHSEPAWTLSDRFDQVKKTEDVPLPIGVRQRAP